MRNKNRLSWTIYDEDKSTLNKIIHNISYHSRKKHSCYVLGIILIFVSRIDLFGVRSSMRNRASLPVIMVCILDVFEGHRCQFPAAAQVQDKEGIILTR